MIWEKISSLQSLALLGFVASNTALASEVLVKADSLTAFEQLLEEARFQTLQLSDWNPFFETPDGIWFKVTLPDNNPDNEFLGFARGFGGILAVEPNFRLYPTAEVSGRNVLAAPPIKSAPSSPKAAPDPQANKLWGLTKIEVNDAWKVTVGSKQTIVANIDTGVDYNHEDLIQNIWRNPKEIPDDNIDNDGNGFVDDVVGWNFKEKNNLPYDANVHGTHTSGTLGATGENGVGISGVAQKTSIMVVKFMGNDGGTVEDAVRSIQYAVDNGAVVINASWGGSENSTALYDAVKYANEKNVLFVAAAGNKWSNADKMPHYPACFDLPNIIGVAISDETDKLPLFSNYGPTSIDLAAPGVNIFSTVPGNSYKELKGTSMATPHVAGAAAVVKSAYPNASALELKSVILDSVDKLPALKYLVTSGGRLNVKNALILAKERFGNKP